MVDDLLQDDSVVRRVTARSQILKRIRLNRSDTAVPDSPEQCRRRINADHVMGWIEKLHQSLGEIAPSAAEINDPVSSLDFKELNQKPCPKVPVGGAMNPRGA
jgi:hypothetical protein